MNRNMIVVATFFLALIALGGCGYIDHNKRSKEVLLLQNIWTMRRAIDFYWQDKERPPQSLQDLVNSGYLREIPADPITGSNQTWVIKREAQQPGQQSQPEIVDVRSGAAGADAGGKAYNQY